ncbi:LacI family DNA-binding transcriptional regulator [Microbacterium sp. KNMS]
MGTKPTLADVSAASGVSVFTVSQALNDKPGVAAATREAVLRAARELGYVPNRAAQELRRSTRDTVAVMTASTSNAYYLDMMAGVQSVLRESGRTAIVADLASDGIPSPEIEDATVRGLVQSRVAGVISTMTLSARNVALLRDWEIPLVFVDSAPPAEVADIASVTTDNVAASGLVGDHLASHGYDEWLLLIYPALWSTRIDRERGMRLAAATHGASLTLLESPNSAEAAARVLGEHLDRTGRAPRALIAGNNPMLRGALEALRARETRVPEQTAVVAFDEFTWAPLLNPPVTVLNEDSQRIGEIAATTICRLIDEQIEAERAGRRPAPAYRPDDRTEVEAELIVRSSCGC